LSFQEETSQIQDFTGHVWTVQ